MNYNNNVSMLNCSIMPIEAVITCVNYGDFLTQTLPFTINQVDRLVVVTSFDDALTQQVCRKWSVEYVMTEVFFEKGEKFNKGQGINMGLQMLRQTGWVISMDADIVLPLTARNMLAKSNLHENNIYGCQRHNVIGWDAWKKLKSSWHDNPQFEYNYMVSTSNEYPAGSTLIHKQFGYAPIGYFQLWHSNWTRKYQLRYPDAQGNAENTDVQWALRWPRQNRILLPTIRVYHLESESVVMGTNWNGRMTKPFTADGTLPKIEVVPSYGY
jgi:hypothetical protein